MSSRSTTPRSCLLVVVMAVTALLSRQLTLSTTTKSCWTTTTSDLLPSIPVRAQGLRKDTGISALRDLVETDSETECVSDQMVLVRDRLLFQPELLSWSTRLIPKVIHVTSRSRCLPTVFADNLQLWKDALPDHSFLFHNDAAMERLLYEKSTDLFPHLESVLRYCSVSVAARADLWRALVLYEYGGVYTDIDNAPGLLFNATSIAKDDQAWFVVEEGGFLSQYFMAATRHHPLLHLVIQTSLLRLLELNDVDHQYVPYVTGPGVCMSVCVCLFFLRHAWFYIACHLTRMAPYLYSVVW
jgi:hypothetical protein